MKLTEAEEIVLVVGAFRYYLGRKTYAVSEFCYFLITHWESFSDRTRNLIQTDLEEQVKKEHQFKPSPLGMNTTFFGHLCDKKEWEQVRALYLGEENAKI